MKKFIKDKIKPTAIIYGLAVIMFIAWAGVKIFKPPKQQIDPHGKSFSVLAGSSKRSEMKYLTYGFLPYWSLNNIEHIQTDKLTDIAYFALRINEDGSIKRYNDNKTLEPGYNNWRNNDDLDNLIEKAHSMGTRISVTLISHEDDKTKSFLNCRSCWDKLSDQLINEMQQKNVHHLNVDFELVEPKAEKELSLKYSQFVNFLNNKLDNKFGDSFVVVSTLPDSMYKPRLTNIESLSKAADALFVMAYDFHRPTSDYAGPVAPINGSGREYEYDVSTMLNDYLSDANPDKLILGVPYYGYNWLIYNNEPNAKRLSGNDFLGYSISQTYENIMEVKLEYNLEEVWDDIAKVPYLTYFNPQKQTLRQVYFENYDSLQIKYQLAKNKNLAGVGFWALGYDGGYQDLWELIEQEFAK